MKRLVLVGFMGSGKTAVGKRAAAKLRLPFVDTDALIEARDGRPIRAIFEEDGEAAFRELEARAIREAAEGPLSVVSTGGGALLRAENVDTLKRTGILIHLAVDAETVLQRTGHRAERPLLAGYADPLARIQELMEARKDVYAQADVRIETSRMSLEEAARAVVEAWRDRCGEH